MFLWSIKASNISSLVFLRHISIRPSIGDDGLDDQFIYIMFGCLQMDDCWQGIKPLQETSH